MPNGEQVKSLVRWSLAWASGIVTGFLVKQGWLSTNQLSEVAAFFTSETVVTIAVGALSAAWGLWTHSRANATAVVAAMSGTKVSGNTIKLVDPALATAAQAAATNVKGQ